MPYLAGLLGIYCLKPNLSYNFKSCSSTVTLSPTLNDLIQLSLNIPIISKTLANLSVTFLSLVVKWL